MIIIIFFNINRKILVEIKLIINKNKKNKPERKGGFGLVGEALPNMSCVSVPLPP